MMSNSHRRYLCNCLQGKQLTKTFGQNDLSVLSKEFTIYQFLSTMAGSMCESQVEQHP